jgi:hypothetical protein
MWKYILLVGRLLKGLAWMTLLVILALLAFLYVAERDLPANWLNRFTDRLSNDQISVQISRASFGLRRGLVLHRLRAFAKGSLDQAFVEIDEAVVSLTPRPRRPYLEWVDAVALRNLRCNDLPAALLHPPADHTASPAVLRMPDLPGMDWTISGADVAGLSLERVSGRLSIANGAIRFANLQLVWPLERWPEMLQGEVTLRPDESRIEGRVAGKTTPQRLRPLLERLHAHSVIRIGSKFTFTTDPVDTQCTFLVAPTAKRYELRVAVKLRNVLYNDVPIREASTLIEGSGPETLSRVVIAPIVVACDAGVARATLIYDDATETLDIDAAGEMAAGPLTEIIEVLDKGELSGITFDRTPRLTVQGRVGVASQHPAPADLTGTVSVASVSLYGLPLRDTSCRFHVRPDHAVAFTAFAGKTPGQGRLAGDFLLLPGGDGTNSSFQTSLRLTDFPLAELYAVFGSTNGPSGKLRATLEMTGRFAPDHAEPAGEPGPVRISEGAFDIRDGEVLGMAFGRVSGHMQATENMLQLTNLSISWPSPQWPESAEGELTVRSPGGKIEGRFQARTTPARLQPLFTCLQLPSLVEIGSRFAFTNQPAAAQGTFRIEPQNDRYELQVSVQATDITYNQVPIRTLQTGIAASGNATQDRIVIDPLVVASEAGNASARLVHDAGADTLFIKAETDMGIDPLTRIIDVLNHGELADIRFLATSKLLAEGVVGLSPRSQSATDLHGTLATPDASICGLPLRNASCLFHIGENFATAITNFTSTTPAGGQVSGEIFLTPDAIGSNTAYRTTLTFATMDLAELFEAFGSSNRPPGKVNAWFDLNGHLGGDRIRHPTGQGRFALTEGSISRIPLFAGFTGYLARNVPGVETLVNQSNGSFNFNATNGLVTSRNVLIEGEVFSLSGKGHYAMPEDKLDFLVQAGIFKRGTLIGKFTRLLTLPFSKLLLEFRVQGSAANPTWEYLGILQRIAETVTDAIAPAAGDKPAP